ncbi:hypothetical protein ACO0LM_28570 [Undibacterium sp. Di26W]|uniref:hypothetical protein n=1 Tax=Undibacterium sp. Di26W TaxID=3413035 RepID=UPI003BF0624A
MKINVSKWKYKAWIVGVILIVVCAEIVFLRSTISESDLKISMTKHFSVRISQDIERIECYHLVKGKDLHGLLDCNYKIRSKNKVETKEVEIPESFLGGVGVEYIVYDQTNQPEMDISIHTKNDVNPLISRLDSYWYLSVL